MEHSDWILDIKGYIDAHLEDSLNIEILAGEAGYSKYHFARMFKEASGIPAVEYIRQRRFIRASEEILHGSRIIDAAIVCGYQTHSGFCKAFKREFGFPPELLRVFGMQKNWIENSRKKRDIGMTHVYMKQTEEHATKEELFRILTETVEKNGLSCNQARLGRAYGTACEIYGGMKRRSGDEYVTHPLHVAILLAEAEAGEAVIIAGMLCDAMEKTNTTTEKIRESVADETADILVEASGFKAENKQISDEALILKLAERLHNMRTVSYMEEAAVRQKSIETMEIFVPLCSRIRNEKLQAEMNDLAMRYL